MPKIQAIKKILVLGSGPIVIGQGAEFDYSGTQALHSLKEEGIEIVLVNSNPATIMTDQESADHVYIEPLTIEFIERIIALEKPDALLPNLGGQTALNLAIDLFEAGILKQYGVTLLGCTPETIKQAEDRDLFRKLMQELSEPVAEGLIITRLEEALAFATRVSYPVIVRPSYTLGGSGGGIASNHDELVDIVNLGLETSPIHQCLVETSISGHKEIEYEVIRDSRDNCIIICNMENIDPVGVHTGDSIVIAPSQTLTDRDHQMLRTSALKIIRALKIEGGCNIQFALDPVSNRYNVIEVNPRISRSSALASKATGFPIAKITAKLALGLTLDEIKNPITQTTYAGFEPALDYVVIKIPRFPFDKFPNISNKLSTQMKATGEVMALGRNFESALQKAIRSLEMHLHDLEHPDLPLLHDDELFEKLKSQDHERLWVIAEMIRRQIPLNDIHAICKVDFFFLKKFQKIISFELFAKKNGFSLNDLKNAKKIGFSDQSLSKWWKMDSLEILKIRIQENILPVYKMVDTCAAEFKSETPYYYSTYGNEDELLPSSRKKVMVLGSGPIRIGQGIEFDYSTVHSVSTIRQEGYEAIVINNNPSTVSTDFNICDRLYFEPLTVEDIYHIYLKEKPEGIIVTVGGQTALNLALSLEKLGIKLLGTPASSIVCSENRQYFEAFLKGLHLSRPEGRLVTRKEEIFPAAEELGFPLMVRPSFVLGGRGMEIVSSERELKDYLSKSILCSIEQPLLLDRYIFGTELEVDAITDGVDVLIPGIMEHIEKAGVHSGDSISAYPPQTISKEISSEIVRMTTIICQSLGIKGLVNLQFVIADEKVYIIEVNPRSSRTVPFLSKITQTPMVKIATLLQLGKTLKELGYSSGILPLTKSVAVKMPVFSFNKLSDLDVVLGPEMKSTGEVMGRENNYLSALEKTFLAAKVTFPVKRAVLVSIANKDNPEALLLMHKLLNQGFSFIATEGTFNFLKENKFPVMLVPKLNSQSSQIMDMIKSGEVQLIILTLTKGSVEEMELLKMIKRIALSKGVMCMTSLDTAAALLNILEQNQKKKQNLSILPLHKWD